MTKVIMIDTWKIHSVSEIAYIFPSLYKEYVEYTYDVAYDRILESAGNFDLSDIDMYIKYIMCEHDEYDFNVIYDFIDYINENDKLPIRQFLSWDCSDVAYEEECLLITLSEITLEYIDKMAKELIKN